MRVARHAQITQSSQNTKVCNASTISQKQVRDEVKFLRADKHQIFLQVFFNTLSIKVSYKFTLSLLMGMMKHSRSSHSNTFAISLQCL